MFVYLADPSKVLHGPVDLPVIPGIGQQLPGNGILLDEVLASPAAGRVWMLNGETPALVPDLRGTVYRKEDGAESEWNELGELPPSFTSQRPPGPHYIYIVDRWVLDQQAALDALTSLALSTRDGLLRDAAIRIAPLQDAVDLEKATDAEIAALRLWKSYRVDLNRIEEAEGFPTEIQWPLQPEKRTHA